MHSGKNEWLENEPFNDMCIIYIYISVCVNKVYIYMVCACACAIICIFPIEHNYFLSLKFVWSVNKLF